MSVVDVVLTVIALVCIVASAALIAASARTDGVVSFLLLAYLVAWAEVVAVVLLLSPLALVTAGTLTGALVACLAGSAAVWLVRGRPRPPRFARSWRVLRGTFHDPAIAVLALVVASGWVYTLALGLLTPPREWDSLAYHLPRAALWLQEHGVGYVANANDPRLNGNPPGAEIGFLATMAVSGGDHLVALPQLTALPALVLGIVGCARRIGLSHRAAVFGGLVFATLPVVAVQAPTTYNDLVVASFLVAFGYAALRSLRPDLLTATLALGLALTTKLTAIVALPAVALVALVGCPRNRRLQLGGAALVGLGLGSPWYLLNLAKTGHADGALTSATAQTQELTLAAIAPTLRRHLYSFVDFSGTRGIPLGALFGSIALAALALGVAWGLARGRLRRGFAIGSLTALVVLLPLLVVVLGRLGLRAWYKLWLVLDRREIAVGDDSWQLQVAPDAALSWFGPVATVLLLAGTAVVLRDVVRRRLPAIAAALALSPFLFVVVFAVLVPWDPWRGRFVVFSVALAATTWGAVLRYRPLVWGATALALVTLPLSLLGMYTKPAGLPFLKGPEGRPPSVWTTSRDDLLAYSGEQKDVGRAIAAIDAAGTATVAAAVRENDFLYPFFGSHLQRTIRLVEHVGGTVPPEATWLVVAPGASVNRCGHWKRAFSTAGWVVEHRLDGATAPCVKVTTAAAEADP